MQFSRNKFTKWLLIIAGVLLVAGSGLYIYSAKFSADEIGGDVFDDLATDPSTVSPTTIRMPEKYTYDQLASAGNVSKSSKSVADQEIAKVVQTKIKEVVKSAPPLFTKNKDGKKVYLDLVFNVADSKGKIVTPATSAQKYSSKKSVQDNFSFDVSVPEANKQIFSVAYPKIEEFYGPRSSGDVIKVIYEKDLSRAYYTPWGNEIHIGGLSGSETSIHETVHAFHQNFCLTSSWEEGMAVKVTDLVMKSLEAKSSSSEFLIEQGYAEADRLNSPDVDITREIDNPWTYSTPYYYGSRTMDILYAADNNFFKSFNSLLYKSKNYWQKSQLIRIAAKSTKSLVEGKTIPRWFSEQIALIDFYSSWPDYYKKPEMFMAWTDYSLNGKFHITIKANYDFGSSDFTTKLTDYKGNIIAGETDCRDTWKTDGLITKECQIADSASQYTGIVNVEITPTNNSENAKVVKSLKSVPFSNDNIFVISEAGGGGAKLTKLSTGESKSVKITDGYYQFIGSISGAEAGDYKLEEFLIKKNCNNENVSLCFGGRVYERQFHKSKSPSLFNTYGSFFLTKSKNNCSPTISNPTVTNHSFGINVNSALNCNSVLSLNTIPIYRYYGKEVKYKINNLKKGAKYSLDVISASAKSLTKTLRKNFTTTNYPDLALLKVENSGNVVDNTFSSKLIFNSALNTSSVNLKLCAGGGMGGCSKLYDVEKTFPSDKTIVIKPKEKLRNNDYYSIEGVVDILDTNGYPIYKVNWQSLNFSTPVNPIGSAEPKFSINKETFSPTEDIVISKNFYSDELPNKLDQFEIIYYDPESDSMKQVPVAVKLVDDKIVISRTELLNIGTDYGVITPEMVDKNNNFVGSRYFNISIK